MAFTAPLHLTVIQMDGPLLLRCEKTGRLTLSISVVDNDHDPGLPHEVALGRDGQNPNLKSVIPVHEVTATTKLIIDVFHHLKAKKKHMKRNFVGSASLSLHEFLNNHPLPRLGSVDYDVQLACYPPQCKSLTLEDMQQYGATLTMRFKVYRSSKPRPYQLDSPPLSPVSVSEHYETEPPLLSRAPSSSRGAQSETLYTNTPNESGEEREREQRPWGKQESDNCPDGTAGLRCRHCRELHGLPVDSDSRAESPEDGHFPTIYDDELRRNADEDDKGEVSFEERFLCWISPYKEITEAAEGRDWRKAEKVLARLQPVWHVVSLALPVLAMVNAGVVTVAPGALFAQEGFPRRALMVSTVAIFSGLMFNAMFLHCYGSCRCGAEFLFLAKDLWADTYVSFSLTCRLPILCLAILMVSFMASFLAVAWTAWPTAMLVVSFVVGLLLTLELVIFGTSRLVSFAIWFKGDAWRTLVRFSLYRPWCPEA
ncbi:hypothetical protein GSI_05735 [Ganoderma sinense ZZ0214-1]|uniref:Uncharacterized protein n=1 Tax=Ganoderma sinense ZZ0214-1 TaxID=1077348 RepID=A0A2G8SBA2_9APHY|nr:hypothetical protein GSI_05735 [Ganoderma sinense ZZ0214-1]